MSGDKRTLPFPEHEPGPLTKKAQPVLKSSVCKLSLHEHTLLAWEIHHVGWTRRARPRFRITIPESYLSTMPPFRGWEFKKTPDGKSIELGASLSGLFPDALAGATRRRGEAENSVSEQWINRPYLPVPAEIAMAADDIRESLGGIHYLGPLRAPAKRFYVAPASSVAEMDATGEFLPGLLGHSADIEVWCLLPGFGGKELAERHPLITAVNHWVHYLRTGDTTASGATDISVSVTKDILIEFMLKGTAGGHLHSLADSGFGYSQVLPIIARGLLTAFGETLIVEQPELHLNPALQVRLALFLCSLVLAGRQVIIETHSEHVVNSIRVAAAEDETGRLAEKTKVMFLDVAQNVPVTHELGLGPDGMMTDWPANFFGEAVSLSGRLLRAQRQHQPRVNS